MAVSHIDALCHVFVGGQMYNGRPATDVKSIGALYNSIEAAFGGIIGRGVLLDIPRGLAVSIGWNRATRSRADELDAAATAQGVAINPGDILLVRTGRDTRRTAVGPWDPVMVGLAGLHPSCIPWIHSHDIAVIGSDGVSDPLPPDIESGWPSPVHQCCLVAMGVHLLDNLQLSRLAEVCDHERRWEFMFSVLPLRIHGGTGSP